MLNLYVSPSPFLPFLRFSVSPFLPRHSSSPGGTFSEGSPGLVAAPERATNPRQETMVETNSTGRTVRGEQYRAQAQGSTGHSTGHSTGRSTAQDALVAL